MMALAVGEGSRVEAVEAVLQILCYVSQQKTTPSKRHSRPMKIWQEFDC